MNPYAQGVVCQNLGKLQNLFLCALGCVWEAFKVDSLKLYTALSHHKACNRGVNSAGEEQKTAATASVRNTACASLLSCVDKCFLFTDFNAQNNLRVTHINLNTAHCGKHRATHLVGNLRRGQWETLVASF